MVCRWEINCKWTGPCSKYFEGQETVSEYDIAVEALGRRPDFNPKHDAIVRVEAHRVRKRLSEFYRREGAGRECRSLTTASGNTPRSTSGKPTAFSVSRVSSKIRYGLRMMSTSEQTNPARSRSSFT